MKPTAGQGHDRAMALSLLLTGCLFSGASHAEASLFQALNPYVELGIAHDTNVFRVDGPAQAGELIDGTQMSDSFWSLETGFDSQLDIQKQKFRLRGRIFHNDYDRYDDVDFTGGDARVAWEWEVGSLWNGELGYEYRRALRDFTNQVTPRIDVSTSNLISALVARRLSTHLQLAASGKLVETEFSRENSLDLRRATTGLSLEYASRRDNTLSLDANYSTRDSQGDANLDYTEFVFGPTLDWSLSEGSRIRATVGYADRDQDNSALGDYSGLVGRITGEWSKSAANSVRMSLWHEVSNFGDEIATFALVTGVKIEPTFQIGSRGSVGFGLGYETRDFRGEPDLPSQILPPRDDDVLTGTLRLEWRFTENSSLVCEYRTESRDSSRVARDYDYDLVQLNFRVGL